MKKIPILANRRHYVRAAKELDSKSNRFCPQGLGSPRHRIKLSGLRTAPAGNANQGTDNKEKETECREQMNCRKIGLSGCQALGLVLYMKNDPFFRGYQS